MSQLIALACGLLTTFASVLFAGKHTLPLQEPALFRQETWFGTQLDQIASSKRSATRKSLSSLLMRQGESSLNYPRNTYYDLAFPALAGMQDIDSSRTLSVNITMPAVQLDSKCRKLSGNNYRAVIGAQNTLFLSQPYTCPNGTKIEITSEFLHSTGTNPKGQVYIGQNLPSVDDLADVNGYDACRLGLNTSEFEFATRRHETYLWGVYSNETELSNSISVYSCTYEWMEVTTKVHLVPIDGVLTIDPKSPPQPDQSTKKPWGHPFAVPSEYAFPEIASGKEWVSLQDAYAVLVQPYGKFTYEDLGNPSKEEEILSGLRKNVAFISAQLANIENRLDIKASSRTGPPPAEGFPAVEATINRQGDYRLVQNGTATCVLIGILSAVVLFNLWGLLSAAFRRRGPSNEWMLDMDVKGLAPDGFNSFAALGSLLRDSNVLLHLPQGAELLSTDELHGMLSHLSFRLGWFREETDQTKHFTIGVLEDEGFQFLGRKKAT